MTPSSRQDPARLDRRRTASSWWPSCRGSWRSPSPNPPGDTRAARCLPARHSCSAHGVPVEYRTAEAGVAQRRRYASPARGAGKHLVLNGHIDVFPGRPARELVARSLERRGRGRQGAWPRRGRHEMRHGRVGVDLHLSAPPARAARRPADAHLRLGRGDRRHLGRQVAGRRVPGRVPRRLRAQRRAVDARRRSGSARRARCGWCSRSTRRARMPPTPTSPGMRSASRAT